MPYLLIYLLTGGVFVLAGLAQKFFPPKSINGLYGYRTSLSMSDHRYWDFAQAYSGKLMVKAGLVKIFTGLLLSFENVAVIPSLIVFLILLLATVILMFVLTQRAIKKRFNLR